MDARLALLLHNLDQAYSRKAWHGPNLKGALRGMSAAEAAWRPGRGRHNAWELAVHAAYWKYAVRRRLTGATRGSFPHPGSNWFARPPGKPVEAAWRADLRLLEQQHRLLREAVCALRPRDLDRRGPGSRYTPAEMVAGAAAHDLYHAGQVSLLKRLAPARA